MRLVSAEEMRALDRLTIERYGTPGHVLMERAGAGATRVLLECFAFVRRRGRRVLVVAGKGNNGGDGFVIARLLRRRGVACSVALLGRAANVGGDAARNLNAFRRGRGVIDELEGPDAVGRLAQLLSKADLVVDAIFGTGLNAPVRALHAEIIELINASGLPVFAVDVPSGLDADTGQPLGVAIQAEATATFGFAKLGQVLFPGARLTGTLAVVDIGLAAEAIAAQPPRAAMLEVHAVGRLVPDRVTDAHKGDAGHVVVIAGSFGKTGAAQLATRSALRVGAGLVTVVGPASLYPVYASAVVEAMSDVLPDEQGRMRFDEGRLRAVLEGKTTVVIGPGLGVDDDTRHIVRWIITRGGLPTVVDADALNCLAGDTAILQQASAPLVLTPHPGEMGRLVEAETAEIQRDRIGVARRFATAHRCTLVLKGAHTVVASPDGFTWINPTGNPGMASGGMGDVLSGVLGGLLAQRLTANEAACLGVYVHGAAADDAAREQGELGLVASDVVAGLPRGLNRLRQCRDE